MKAHEDDEYTAGQFIPLLHEPAKGFDFFIVEKKNWKYPSKSCDDPFNGIYWYGDARNEADAIRRAKKARGEA